MSLLFATGFNGITAAQIARRFPGSTTTGLTMGTSGRGSRRSLTIDSNEIYIPLAGSTQTTMYVGMSFYHSSPSSSGRTIFQFRSPTAGIHASLKTGSDRILRVFDAGGTERYTHGVAYTASTWYFLEMRVTTHDTTGRIQVWLDGTSIYDSGTTLDTKNGASGTIQDIAIGMGLNTMITDTVYVTDDAGSAPDNGRLGNTQVDFVESAADGATVQFTPLSSTNESNIDDGQTPDDDTSYNQSSTAGHVDLFTVGSYSAPGTIYGVIARAVVKKTDTDARTFRAKVKSSASTLNGATSTLTTSYAEVQAVAEVDPNTSAAWGASAVSSMSIGYEVVA